MTEYKKRTASAARFLSDILIDKTLPDMV